MTQRIQEQVRILAAIESESHFCAVGLKMLRANAVPATHNAALQKRERGLDGVGMGIALGIDAELVTDSLVSALLAVVGQGSAIRSRIIGVKNINIFAQVLADVLQESSAPRIFGVEEPQFSATLTDSENDFFVIESGLLALEPILAADIGFVHFDFTVEHRPLRFDHCGPDTVTKVPRRLVASEAERALNLASGHALLGFAEKQGSDKPLRKRQVGIVEDRPGSYGELVVTLFAVVERLFGFEFRSIHLAARAADAFGPAEPGKHLAALIFGREHGVYVN